MVKKPKKLFNDKKIYHIPVLSNSMFAESIVDSVGTIHTLNKKKSPYFYPTLMLSYYYYVHKNDIMDEFNEENIEGSLFCDSGGLQDATIGDVDIDPKEVARTYDNYDMIKAGFIVDDIPSYTGEDERRREMSTYYQDKWYKKHAEKTKENIKEMLEVDPDVNLYNILQCGQKFTNGKAWYEVVSDYDLDGYCIAVKPPSNYKNLVFMLAYLVEQGVDNVHVLGTGGKVNLDIILYAKNYFENITCDSSDPKGHNFWNLKMPHNTFKVSVPVGPRNKADDIDGKFPCPCPVCKEYDFKFGEDVEEINERYLYDLHNHYWRIVYIRQLDFLRNNRELYRKFTGTGKSRKMLNLFEECLEKGVESVAMSDRSQLKSLSDWGDEN